MDLVQQEFKNSMVTIFTITYNEELLISFFIEHYRKMFPNCRIVVFDNQSTDSTVEIARQKNCEVITYDTQNKLSDLVYLQIKETCWHDAKTDWVIVCDCDELIMINESELKVEEDNGIMIFKSEGYSIMNCETPFVLDKLKMGFRDFGYDKCVLFNKKFISKINYSPGCHNCNPEAINCDKLIYNTNNYKLLHYKYLNPEYTIQRHKMFGDRLSDDNKKRGWGIHYTFSTEVTKQFYKDKQSELIEIL